MKKFHYALQRAKGIPIHEVEEKRQNQRQSIQRLRLEYKDLSDSQLRVAVGSCDTTQLSFEKKVAAVITAAERSLELSPFTEQVDAAILLYTGAMVQMQTGEGKTLAAAIAAVLLAAEGKNVHIITANQYLAGRDARWMKPLYSFFNLTVSWVGEHTSTAEKKLAYHKKICYVTAKQVGFDYLQDNLAYSLDDKVNPVFDSCIIDEADFILIDEARIPLVVAGIDDTEVGGEATTEDTQTGKRGIYTTEFFRDAAAKLTVPDQVFIDKQERNCRLTLEGIQYVRITYGIDDATEEGRGFLSGLNVALHALHLLKRGRDYVVTAQGLFLVDAFTGRRAEKREWPYGIQRALEAKEGLCVKPEGRVKSSITIENLIKLYPRLSAMTATAEVCAREIFSHYGLETWIVPLHKIDRRVDHPDYIFTTRDAKYTAAVEEITSAYRRSQPVLVGTATISESYLVSDMLQKAGVPHKVLNAEQDSREAELIAQAGRPGAVTVATNMAGRGTDIVTNSEKTGGLYVIGLNRHESGRVDRQLRGRAARQGDPGETRFYLSLEDPLFVHYGIQEFIPAAILKRSDGKPVSGKRVQRELDRAQEILEQQHATMRYTLYRYTAIIEIQRRQICELREGVLNLGEFPSDLLESIEDCIDESVRERGEQATKKLLCLLFLSELDRFWSDYLLWCDEIREGIHLRRLGKRDPLTEFIMDADEVFSSGLQTVIESCSARIHSEGFGSINTERIIKSGNTWTYLISDNPFPSFKLGLAGLDSATSLFVGIQLFVLAPVFWLLNLKKRFSAWCKKRMR